ENLNHASARQSTRPQGIVDSYGTGCDYLHRQRRARSQHQNRTLAELLIHLRQCGQNLFSTLVHCGTSRLQTQSRRWRSRFSSETLKEKPEERGPLLSGRFKYGNLVENVRACPVMVSKPGWP